jgi:hypothetical protein
VKKSNKRKAAAQIRGLPAPAVRRRRASRRFLPENTEVIEDVFAAIEVAVKEGHVEVREKCKHAQLMLKTPLNIQSRTSRMLQELKMSAEELQEQRDIQELLGE